MSRRTPSRRKKVLRVLQSTAPKLKSMKIKKPKKEVNHQKRAWNFKRGRLSERWGSWPNQSMPVALLSTNVTHETLPYFRLPEVKIKDPLKCRRRWSGQSSQESLTVSGGSCRGLNVRQTRLYQKQRPCYWDELPGLVKKIRLDLVEVQLTC